VGRLSEKAQSDRALATQLGTAQDLGSAFVNRLVGGSIRSPGTNEIKYLRQFPPAAYVAYVAKDFLVFSRTTINRSAAPRE
jgi:hypothetical protein